MLRLYGVLIFLVFLAYICFADEAKPAWKVEWNRDPLVIESGVSDLDIQTILDIHNMYRNRTDVISPGMSKLYWHEGIAEKAQVHASNCKKNHDKMQERLVDSLPGTAIGQNMAVGIDSWKTAIGLWFGEKHNFKYGVTSTGGVVINFSQLMSPNLILVGCGYANCSMKKRTQKGKRFTVGHFTCNYAPRYNKGDIKTSWVEGLPCVECEDNCIEGLCDCKGKICANAGILNMNTCTCACWSPNFQGEFCEIPVCDNENDWTICKKFRPEDCTTWMKMGNLCPFKCGRC